MSVRVPSCREIYEPYPNEVLVMALSALIAAARKRKEKCGRMDEYRKKWLIGAHTLATMLEERGYAGPVFVDPKEYYARKAEETV